MAKGQAILCHSIGWEDEKIAEAIGVAPSIVRRWVGNNDQNTTLANIGKDGIFTKNSKGCIMAKPVSKQRGAAD